MSPPNQLQDALATTLLSNLAAFQSFARRRIGDEQLAADAVQESLLRALKSDREWSDEDNLVGCSTAFCATC
jgi:DNA-directed RNA polymerase specialized sigma24 family protein